MTDPFEPFRPLMIPLSGVEKMCLLTLGDKSVLAIGEVHQTDFCKPKYTPLPEIVEGYLANTRYPVDLMVEMDKFTPPSFGSRMLNWLFNRDRLSIEARQVVTEIENRPLEGYDEPLTIINLLRLLLESIPQGLYPYARIHWIDELKFPHSRNKGDQLLTHFKKFVLAAIEGLHEKCDTERRKIDLCMIHDFGYTPTWSSGPNHELYNNKQEKLSFNDHGIADFLHCCYDALRESRYFRKCYGGDPSRQELPSWEIYREAFLACYWVHITNKSINPFYFYIQRFFVDMYTCCRIMKKDPRWFKNIVIYTGALHTNVYIFVLSRMGYVAHDIPLPYDATCQQLPSSKRRKGGHWKLSRRRRKFV
jgi:hypothetical protein